MLNNILRLLTIAFSITRNPDPGSFADRLPKEIFS